MLSSSFEDLPGLPNGAKGSLRLFSDKLPDGAKNLWDEPNVLLQKFPAEEFTVTTKLTFTPNPKLENERVGLTVMGLSYAGLVLKNSKEGLWLMYITCTNAAAGAAENESQVAKLTSPTAHLRVAVAKGGVCTFSYSTNGNDFTPVNKTFTAVAGKWKGAKVGLFCTRESQTNDAGYADVDWFRMERITPIP